MRIESISCGCFASYSEPIVVVTVRDTLIEGSSKTSDGCVTSMLRAVGRFFAWLFCCSKTLPEFSESEFRALLNHEFIDHLFKGCMVKKLSETHFVITLVHFKDTSSYECELVPFEDSFALKIKGKWHDESFFFHQAFPPSYNLILVGVPEFQFSYLTERGFEKRGDEFVKRGSSGACPTNQV